MPSGDINQENARILAVSTGGFAVFVSLLFLFERLGVAAGVLIWAMAASIIAISIVLAISRANLDAELFAADGRRQGVAYQMLIGVSAVISPTLAIIVIIGPAAGSYSSLFYVAAVFTGFTIGGIMFSGALRDTEAGSMAHFLGILHKSAGLRFLTALIAAIINLLLLFAEVKLSGYFLADYFNLGFAQISGVVIVIAAVVALAGGTASVSWVQSALFLLFLIVVIPSSLWIAQNLTGLPIPQLLIFQSGDGSVSSLANPAVMAEINEFSRIFRAAPYQMATVVAIGTAALPHLINRHVSAASPKLAQQGHYRAIILVLLILSIIPALQFATPVVSQDIGKVSYIPLILKQFVPIAVLIAAISLISLHLITIANMLAFDCVRSIFSGRNPAGRQMFISRTLILVSAALIWVYVGSGLSAISALIWALVIACSSLFPAMLATRFWPAASRAAIASGMVISIAIVGSALTAIETGFGRLLISTSTGFDPLVLKPAIFSLTIGALTVNIVVIYIVSTFGSRKITANPVA